MRKGSQKNIRPQALPEVARKCSDAIRSYETWANKDDQVLRTAQDVAEELYERLLEIREILGR